MRDSMPNRECSAGVEIPGGIQCGTRELARVRSSRLCPMRVGISHVVGLASQRGSQALRTRRDVPSEMEIQRKDPRGQNPSAQNTAHEIKLTVKAIDAVYTMAWPSDLLFCMPRIHPPVACCHSALYRMRSSRTSFGERYSPKPWSFRNMAAQIRDLLREPEINAGFKRGTRHFVRGPQFHVGLGIS